MVLVNSQGRQAKVSNEVVCILCSIEIADVKRSKTYGFPSRGTS